MKIQSERFGTIEFAPEEIIEFPQGIIGFRQERQFALVPHGASGLLAWLQSVKTPALALPVVSAHAFGSEYPDVDLAALCEAAGLGSDVENLAILVVLCAPRHQPATVNMLAPIVVNADTRKAAQIFLDGSRFTTRELFVLPGREEAAPQASSVEISAAAG